MKAARVYLDWPPTVNHYYTVARGRKILSKRGRKWKEEQLVLLRLQEAPVLARGRMAVRIEALCPDARARDLDNLLKPVLDVLVNYGVLHDDAQVDDLQIVRHPIIQAPGMVEVRVWELGDGR